MFATANPLLLLILYSSNLKYSSNLNYIYNNNTTN